MGASATRRGLDTCCMFCRYRERQELSRGRSTYGSSSSPSPPRFINGKEFGKGSWRIAAADLKLLGQPRKGRHREAVSEQ